MKYIVSFLVLVLIGLSGLYFVKNKEYEAESFYNKYENVESVNLSDEKYAVYFYNENDLYSSMLKDEVARFAGLLEENGGSFYLVDMGDIQNEEFYAKPPKDDEGGQLQSGTDYPVTPEQGNEIGLDNFKVAGTPVLLTVKDGKVIQIGTGIQTPEMGNSYISVQDAMEKTAKEFGFEFEYVEETEE